MTDLDELSGDVAGLIGYRLHDGGMSWAPPRVGRAYLAVTCEIRGYSGDLVIPAKFYPDVHDEPEPAPTCGTCGSDDPDIAEGLPFCPNDFHYGPDTWAPLRQFAAYALATLVIALFLLSLFLYTAGVMP